MADEPVVPEEIDPTDPYHRQAQTFPVLKDAMVRRIAAYGVEELLTQGAALFSRGDRSVDFFVVLDGAVEIYDLKGIGGTNVFTVHRAHQFTGELDLFNNRRILVYGRAAEDTRVIRVKRPDFRRMVHT